MTTGPAPKWVLFTFCIEGPPGRPQGATPIVYPAPALTMTTMGRGKICSL